MPQRFRCPAVLVALLLSPGVWAQDPQSAATPPAPPESVEASDHPLDGGNQIDVRFPLSPDDKPAEPAQGDAASAPPAAKPVAYYIIRRSAEINGLYEEVARVEPTKWNYADGFIVHTVDQCEPGQEYYFRVSAVSASEVESPTVQTEQPVRAEQQWVDSDRLWFGMIMFVICSAVIWYIAVASSGRELKIRRIAGLEAVDEAVGRATEMGRSCLFIPGIQDMNDIQTVAGITVLSRVAKVAAEYDAKVEVPNCRALVMTAARETVQSAYLAAGRPDSYNPDLIYYVTDEQFGYVAYLSGMMVREKPAACFYMGAFYAESLILAETGNQVGAIQVAGTAMPSQLPFFVAACDYTLIGEEFFAASAYLSGEPHQLGSLKGQDVGKVIVAVGLLIGCVLATIAAFPNQDMAERAVAFIQDVMLK